MGGLLLRNLRSVGQTFNFRGGYSGKLPELGPRHLLVILSHNKVLRFSLMREICPEQSGIGGVYII